MQIVFPLLVGMLVGILMTWWLQLKAHRNALRVQQSERHYEPARRAAARHLHTQGTLNSVQFERMLDISHSVATHYLELMVRDGLLKQHDHSGSGIFYTRV